MRYDNHNPIDTRWFVDRLADRRLSQRGLAKHMGLDPAAVSLMLRGRRKANAKEIAEMARLLGVGVDEVVARLGVGMPAKREPRAFSGSGGSGGKDVTVRNAKDDQPPPAPTMSSISSDADFLMKWMELGNYLLNKR